FCIMFVSVGMVCFISQTSTVGRMYYKSRKPIHAIVLAQAVLGIIVSFVTLLASLTDIDCTFRLIFSIVGVNIGNIALQAVLLWKAYLGNNRSKIILVLGIVPIIAISIFIIANMTIGKSSTFRHSGTCITEYPLRIVVAKATIDATSNVFLSWCFILVIYRHYRILGSNTPVIYTIDWYLASFLIIKQLRSGNKIRECSEDDAATVESFNTKDEEESV
ncbi:hypothetical protein K501DRAFT_158271, partial [Backusella circina FSU 941]